MTSATLHSPPRYRTVAYEQFRAVRMALHKEGMFFLGFLGFIGILTILSVLRVVQGHVGCSYMQFSSSGNEHAGLMLLLVPVGFVGLLLPFGLAGLIVPFGLWRSEDPSRRSYHWAMPISRELHTLTKVLSGWLWLMVALIVYIAFMIGLIVVVKHICLDTHTVAIHNITRQLMTPFIATNILYLLTSVSVIGSEHPWRWIGGSIVVYAVALTCFVALGLHGAVEVLGSVMTGKYGLFAALFGGLGHGVAGNASLGPVSANAEVVVPTIASWVKAALLWTIASGLGVCLATYHRRDA
jgi:hypothetical protein